jgi:hypothetical protein
MAQPQTRRCRAVAAPTSPADTATVRPIDEVSRAGEWRRASGQLPDGGCVEISDASHSPMLKGSQAFLESLLPRLARQAVNR